MKQIFRSWLLVSPFILGITVITSAAAIAVEVPEATVAAQSQHESVQPKSPLAHQTGATHLAQTSNQDQEATSSSPVLPQDTTSVTAYEATDSVGQVTSVSQLSDVQPTDWAFQALQSLVERYGCIAGYPDGTYRGNRALTRYEFAAGLNACLDRVNELIATATADLVRREDLATLQRLQEEFAAELATLRGRVDALEAATAELEANQFSTTTKLNGEVIVAATEVFGEDVEDNYNTVLQARARLNFDTSFSGDDRLRIRLQAGNFQSFESIQGTFDATTGPAPAASVLYNSQDAFSFGTNTDFNVEIGWLEYYFQIGENTVVFLEATGAALSDIVSSISPLDDSGVGSLSYFGYNPIYDLGFGAGAGINVGVFGPVSLGFGYLTDEASDPTDGAGLTNGDYGAIAQLTIDTERLRVGLAYVNSYRGTVTQIGELGEETVRLGPSVTNAYGISANYRISNGLEIGGWVTYAPTRIIGEADATVWTYAGTLIFPDLGGEGNLGAIIVGVPPRVADYKIGDDRIGTNIQDATLHVEGLYRFQVSDNIYITPGVIWLNDPGNDNDASDTIIGTVRTTFSF